jgi:hypothetical protein
MKDDLYFFMSWMKRISTEMVGYVSAKGITRKRLLCGINILNSFFPLSAGACLVSLCPLSANDILAGTSYTLNVHNQDTKK